MEYTVIIEKDPKTNTYTGQCVQLPAAISQGDTYEELMENMKDAINLVSAIPRHPDLNDITCMKICKQLDIPYPGKN